MHIWVEKVKHWLKEQSLSQSARSYFEGKFEDQMEVDRISENDLPIWLAAQKAVTRYEGFLSPVGPRGRLLRKLLTWVGFIPTSPETSFKPNFLSRISLSDLWKPASKENCGNNIWKMFKTSLSILFSQSIIQEPAFQELILLYTEDSPSNGDAESGEFPALQLKIYDKIPIPDLPVIFPHKKLSFRILDTVRLDVASILGLLAFLVNYKFENILSSPSALLLDVIAFSALIIYVSRVILGYKQTWDRYQDENVYSQMEVKVCLRTASLHYKLLVNKTLYEKTIASGFGSVYFLLDASEQQQYKETLLAYAILLCVVDWQVSCRKSIGTACERFMYEKFNEKVEMPIDKAVDTLLRLNLVKEVLLEENFVLQVLPCSKACEVLRQRWASLID
ncbi:hypothetical protein QJS04_geneDACA006642 [Acorus gramineus]|uniref:Uncharacterized protein n=1 Tax=Acorus gramineus TaxID=55184 RepID=A0AAV9A2P4_ACOGR|nr:hypothetical protein QJS04_geneDACA006642 [Acorus gramineus]